MLSDVKYYMNKFCIKVFYLKKKIKKKYIRIVRKDILKW